MAKTVNFTGCITLEQLKTLTNSQQACLIYGGLLKNNIKTWEALKQWRLGLRKTIKTLLNRAFPDYEYDYDIKSTLFTVNVYTDNSVRYKKTTLATCIGHVLQANFPCYTLAFNTQHITKGFRKPTKARVCLIGIALKANGHWEKTSTKSEILGRY